MDEYDLSFHCIFDYKSNDYDCDAYDDDLALFDVMTICSPTFLNMLELLLQVNR